MCMRLVSLLILLSFIPLLLPAAEQATQQDFNEAAAEKIFVLRAVLGILIIEMAELLERVKGEEVSWALKVRIDQMLYQLAVLLEMLQIEGD